MRKAMKYRLFPTKAQTTVLEQTLDACRWVYNKTLEVRKTAWEHEQRSVSYFETKRLLPQWKAEHPFLHIAHSQVLQNVTERVDLAFKAFFRRVKAGEKLGYPRFRGKHRYDSFTYPQANAFTLHDEGAVSVSKLGRLRLSLHRPIQGTIKTLTLCRDALGRWYASFSVEVEPTPLPPSPRVAGVDVGFTTFAKLSDDTSIDNPRFFRRDEKALRKAQRKLSAQEQGTPARAKARRVVQHIHQRITNRRTDFAHKASRKLVNRYQVIVCEELDIRDMQANGHRSRNKSIADAAWGQFLQYTSAKAAEAGRTLLKVFPRGTTQDCSGCGATVPKGLSVRVHSCPQCGLTLDRDLNAALNILARGLARLGASAS
jgi:putative transposase